MPVSSDLRLKVKNCGNPFRLVVTWSTKESTARETKDIREDHLKYAFGPTDRA